MARVVPLELIFAHLHIYFGLVLVGWYLLLRRFSGSQELMSLIYWTLMLEVAWVGVVVRYVYQMALARAWNPYVKLVFFLAFSLFLWELMREYGFLGPVLRIIVAVGVGFALVIWLIPGLLTGWIADLQPYFDPATIPDDGKIRDSAFGSEVVAKAGWFLYTFFVLIIMSIVLVVFLRWLGFALAVLIVFLTFVFMVIVLAVNLFDVTAAALRELAGWEFNVPERFGLAELLDPANWDWTNWQFPEIEIPEFPEIEIPGVEPIEAPVLPEVPWWPPQIQLNEGGL